ncbi:MAG: OmpA family protein [Alphaproteobacteria bacterium]
MTIKDVMNKANDYKKAAALSIMIGAAPGCATLEQAATSVKDTVTEYDKTAITAVIGGVAGMAVSSKKDRAKGFVIGATAAGTAGYIWDRMEKDLRENLEGAGVTVTRGPEGIQLDVQNDVTFDKNSASIQPAFYHTLNKLANVLDKYDDTNIRVAGHTDSSGSDAYNQELSSDRAHSVAGYLDAQGVEAHRLRAIGFGETYADQSTADPADRRVEIDIIPQ